MVLGFLYLLVYEGLLKRKEGRLKRKENLSENATLINKLNLNEVRLRRTPLRFMGSLACDLDIFLDWFFIVELWNTDYEKDDPPLFYSAVVFASIGTFLWVLLIFDINFTRIIYMCQLYKCFGTNRCANTMLCKKDILLSWVLPLLNIVLEDLPQVVITIIYIVQKNKKLSEFAKYNLATSVLAIILKILELVENKDQKGLNEVLKTNKHFPKLMNEKFLLEERAMEMGEWVDRFELCRLNRTDKCILDMSGLKPDKLPQQVRDEIENNDSLGIETLNVSRNQHRLSADGIRELTTSLHKKDCCMPWELDLSHNKIGDEGANVIASFLATNKFLTCLNISHNLIGEEGAGNIVAALKINSTLTEIIHHDNFYDNEAAKAIDDALDIFDSFLSFEYDSQRSTNTRLENNIP
mmetsp:Transcript_42423/g.47425  ORF Transcript_42423/g.47425 Transcript_42423/m.47425 type:complete len:410 (+) Transcript_42423:86-1315(+)